jgi:hypothetical protein
VFHLEPLHLSFVHNNQMIVLHRKLLRLYHLHNCHLVKHITHSLLLRICTGKMSDHLPIRICMVKLAENLLHIIFSIVKSKTPKNDYSV